MNDIYGEPFFAGSQWGSDLPELPNESKTKPRKWQRRIVRIDDPAAA